MTTTFVTSFINIDNGYKTMSWRFEKFIELVKSGINLCVYVDSTVIDTLINMTKSYNNVKFMKTVSLQETKTFQICENYNLILPLTDNVSKDTYSYMTIINSKIEFVNDAILNNPWNSKVFAWIDFSITHVLSDINYAYNTLNELSHLSIQSKLLAIPGCYNYDSDINSKLINEIYWRFCGGFFIGDKESLLEMYHVQFKYLPIFLDQYKTMVWEVNYWAWLEANTEWKPYWFKADHNNSIIVLPRHLINPSLFNQSTITIYDYPNINVGDDFYKPGSASYINYKGKHLLNTRYINYSLKDKQFIFHHPDRLIISKNVFSVLNDKFIPLDYQEIKDPPTNNPLGRWNGIEDIRLYEFQDKIHFVATSLSHSTENRNLIVTGLYDTEILELTHCRMIEPPHCSTCEKNWTPIIQKNNGIESEFFVYKWFPMEIGQIVNDKLEIIIIHETPNTFRNFRGSTVFNKWGEYLIGVVHFCEEEYLNRKYFHVLVMLDIKTMLPLKYSNPFYFGLEAGIEFCIGFSIKDLKYHFWISQLDNNPQQISVPIKAIPFFNVL
jgi:hypothetical protein